MKILVFSDSEFENDLCLPAAKQVVSLDDADFCSAKELKDKLFKDYDVFIHPYGGFFPKEAFPALISFLKKGNGFLCFNGAPVRFPCYQSPTGWKKEREQLSYLRKMNIHSVLAVDCTDIVSNEISDYFSIFPEDISFLEYHTPCENFVMTPTKNAYVEREWGSVGSMDTRIIPLIKGRNREGEHRSSPVVLLEHRAGDYSGGRWIFITQRVTYPFSLQKLCSFLSAGTRELLVKPSMAMYFNGEVPCVAISAQNMRIPCDWTVDVCVTTHTGQEIWKQQILFSVDSYLSGKELVISELKENGVYFIRSVFSSSDGETQIIKQGFIYSNIPKTEPYVPFLPTQDYFTKDGNITPVIGMTYMARDVSRAFLHIPNISVWLNDMANMKKAGINWLRTGVWCNWRTYMLDDGHMDEFILRSIQAFMECAYSLGLHVTFTFFTFVPEPWEGSHPYLDRRSVEAQKRFISLIVSRCRNYPNVDWDLINEPYVQDHPTQTKKTWDKLEQSEYRAYLEEKYQGDIRKYTENTRQDSATVSSFDKIKVPVCDNINFTVNDIAGAKNGLVWREYLDFNYAVFINWMHELQALIKSYAPHQMVTVGQDEAIHYQRPVPLNFGGDLDYNCQHTWWLNDHLVWDTVFAKFSEKPLMVQETGIMYAEQPNSLPRRTEKQLYQLLQKKYAYAFGTKCAGVIQWIWNSNYFMNNANESNIGALRCDGSYKKEVDVSKNFASFFAKVKNDMGTCIHEKIAVVFPFSNDRSNRNFAQKATMNACTALAYYLNAGFEAVSEYALDFIEKNHYQMVIVPSPHSFSNDAFKKLISIAEKKEIIILFTGPTALDEDYSVTSRTAKYMQECSLSNLSRWTKFSLLGKEYSLFFGDDEQTRAMKESYHGQLSQIVSCGKGKIYFIGVPIELSLEINKIAEIYAQIIKTEKIALPFTAKKSTEGIFISRIQWETGACLYTAVNENDSAEHVAISDQLFQKSFKISLAPNDIQLFVVNAKGEKTAEL